MKIVSYLIYLIVCGFFFVGCISQDETINTPASSTRYITATTDLHLEEISSNPSETPFVYSTATPAASPTPEPTASIIPTNMPTTTPTSFAEVISLCGSFYESLDDVEQSPEGVVIQNNEDSVSRVEIFGNGLDSNAVDFPPRGSWTTDVSPNGQWLVHTSAEEYDEDGNAKAFTVTVLNPSTNEQIQSSIQTEPTQLNIDGFKWLNDTQLINAKFPENNLSSFNFIVLSPFMNEKQVVSLSLDGYEHILYGGTTFPVVDPLFQYVVYPCYNESVCGETDYRVLDISTEEVIWSINNTMISTFTFPLSKPVWSPDGQYLAVFGRQESNSSNLMIFDRTGKMIQEVTFDNLGAGGGASKWSPDGNKILFRLSRLGKDNQFQVTLAYLNLENGTTYDSCVANIQKYYWSPDSKGAVIEYVDNSSEEIAEWLHNIVLFDITSGDILKIFESSSPDHLLGWVEPSQN